MKGYRKRTCPRCRKTSMWYGDTAITPQQDAILDLFSRAPDKDAIVRVMLEYLRTEYGKLIRDTFVTDTLKEIGVTTAQLESDWLKSLPSALALLAIRTKEAP